MADSDERSDGDDGDLEVHETGDIYFLYRPKVETHAPAGEEDVQRHLIVLAPDDRQLFRVLVVGRKHLPDIDAHERSWGFVETISRSADELERGLREQRYQTKTRGERVLPAARPAAEGRYLLAHVGGGLQLVYELALPHRPGPVQEELNIAPEASFVVSIRNPDAPAPGGVGRGREQQPDFPPELRARFGERRFGDDPAMLDYAGAEFVLIGARENPEEAHGTSLDVRPRRPDRARILSRLRMATERHPPAPLFRGEWA